MVERLIATLHDCPASHETWRRFLDEISLAFTCSFSGFARWTQAEASDISFSTGVDSAHIDAYHRHWSKVNPWILEGSGKLTDGVVLPTEALVPDDRFTRSEFFSDFLHRNKIGRYGVAAQIQSGRETVHLSLVRTARWSPFSSAELRAIERLVPHIRTAMLRDRMAAQMRVHNAATADALDALPFAIVILGTPLIMNRSAEQLVQRHRTVFVRSGATFRIAGSAPDAALQRRVAQAQRQRAAIDPPFVVRAEDGTRFRVAVVPAFDTAVTTGGRRAVIITVKELWREGPLAALLFERYRLTEREATLAIRLQSLGDLRRTADHMRITHATARAHLVHVFRKMDIHSQRELHKLVEELRGQS